MGKYLLRRLLLSIPILFLITVLNFIFIHLSPGDPVLMMIPPEMLQGGGIPSEEWVKEQRQRLGLDKPLPVQYAIWLGNIARGNFGNSLSVRKPVAPMLKERIWPTIKLTGTALLVSFAVGISVGVFSAIRQYSAWDYAATFFSFIAVSVPNFFLGLVFIYIFALKLGWFPTSGMYTLGKDPTLLDTIRHMTLPVLVIGLSGAAGLVRYTRASMLEVLRQDYITTARSKGVSEWRVNMVHALRNGLLPVITVISLSLPNVFGGSVIVEQIFNWPGMGTFAIRGVFGKDYPIIMAVNLIAASLVLGANLLADAAYALADPRIRYD